MFLRNENILVLCGFLDLFSVSMFITTLSLHIKSFDVSTTHLGFFYSLYGALQMLSGYTMGYLADKVGQKRILCLCSLISALGYFALGLAPSFWWVFAMRFITGLFKQTQTVSRTILSTCGGSSIERIRVLGLFSTLSSVGFIFGPPLGGWVYESYGFASVTKLTGAGFVLMFCLFLTMPSSPTIANYKQKKKEEEYQPSKYTQSTQNPEIEVTLRSSTLQDSSVVAGDGSGSKSNQQNNSKKNYNVRMMVWDTWDILLAVFLVSFCPMLFRTNYSLALREMFGSTGTLSGFATSFGAITGSTAGVLSPYILIQYNKRAASNSGHSQEPRVIFHTCIVLALSILGCSLAPSLTVFVLCQLPISFVNNVSREAFNVVISKRVDKDKVGRMLGLNGSLVAMGRLTVPIIGGFLQEWSFRLPPFVACLSAFLGAGVVKSVMYYR